MFPLRRSVLVLALVFASLSATACSSTASVQSVVVTSAPKATMRQVVVQVDKNQNNDNGEATALENGIIEQLRKGGYEIGEEGLLVRATITKIDRGSGVADALIGPGAGADFVEVSVSVSDWRGEHLMTFLVRGSAIDKRFTQLHGVLREDVAEEIKDQMVKARR